MSSDLHTHPLFRIQTEFLSPDERVALSYKRARVVLRTHSQLLACLIYSS